MTKNKKKNMRYEKTTYYLKSQKGDINPSIIWQTLERASGSGERWVFSWNCFYASQWVLPMLVSWVDAVSPWHFLWRSSEKVSKKLHCRQPAFCSAVFCQRHSPPQSRKTRLERSELPINAAWQCHPICLPLVRRSWLNDNISVVFPRRSNQIVDRGLT